jgi:hypothetical protein
MAKNGGVPQKIRDFRSTFEASVIQLLLLALFIASVFRLVKWLLF